MLAGFKKWEAKELVALEKPAGFPGKRSKKFLEILQPRPPRPAAGHRQWFEGGWSGTRCNGPSEEAGFWTVRDLALDQDQEPVTGEVQGDGGLMREDNRTGRSARMILSDPDWWQVPRKLLWLSGSDKTSLLKKLNWAQKNPARMLMRRGHRLHSLHGAEPDMAGLARLPSVHRCPSWWRSWYPWNLLWWSWWPSTALSGQSLQPICCGWISLSQVQLARGSGNLTWSHFNHHQFHVPTTGYIYTGCGNYPFMLDEDGWSNFSAKMKILSNYVKSQPCS